MLHPKAEGSPLLGNQTGQGGTSLFLTYPEEKEKADK